MSFSGQAGDVLDFSIGDYVVHGPGFRSRRPLPESEAGRSTHGTLSGWLMRQSPGRMEALPDEESSREDETLRLVSYRPAVR